MPPAQKLYQVLTPHMSHISLESVKPFVVIMKKLTVHLLEVNVSKEEQQHEGRQH